MRYGGGFTVTNGEEIGGHTRKSGGNDGSFRTRGSGISEETKQVYLSSEERNKSILLK